MAYRGFHWASGRRLRAERLHRRVDAERGARVGLRFRGNARRTLSGMARSGHPGNDVRRPGQGDRRRAHQAADGVEGPDRRAEGAHGQLHHRLCLARPVLHAACALGKGRRGRRQGAGLEGSDVQRPGHCQRDARGDATGARRQPGGDHHAGRRQCAAEADQGCGRASYSGDRHPCDGVPRAEPRTRPLS